MSADDAGQAASDGPAGAPDASQVLLDLAHAAAGAGPADWTRLGRILAACRLMLDVRYANRHLFAAERGLNYRLTNDIEHAPRFRQFQPATLLAAEAAYGLAPGSSGLVLRGGSPVAADPARQPVLDGLVRTLDQQAEGGTRRANGR